MKGKDRKREEEEERKFNKTLQNASGEAILDGKRNSNIWLGIYGHSKWVQTEGQRNGDSRLNSRGRPFHFSAQLQPSGVLIHPSWLVIK